MDTIYLHLYEQTLRRTHFSSRQITRSRRVRDALSLLIKSWIGNLAETVKLDAAFSVTGAVRLL
jgi:hypothetical protein